MKKIMLIAFLALIGIGCQSIGYNNASYKKGYEKASNKRKLSYQAPLYIPQYNDLYHYWIAMYSSKSNFDVPSKEKRWYNDPYYYDNDFGMQSIVIIHMDIFLKQCKGDKKCLKKVLFEGKCKGSKDIKACIDKKIIKDNEKLSFEFASEYFEGDHWLESTGYFNDNVSPKLMNALNRLYKKTYKGDFNRFESAILTCDVGDKKCYQALVNNPIHKFKLDNYFDMDQCLKKDLKRFVGENIKDHPIIARRNHCNDMKAYYLQYFVDNEGASQKN